MNFSGKTVLITGASRGIGFSIAKNFFKMGAKIIGTSTNDFGVNKINRNFYGRGKGYILDFLKPYTVDNFVTEIKNNFKNIDILVNNSGIIQDGLLVKMKNEQWDNVINVNLNSVFLMSRLVLPYMIKNNYGRIISISSASSFLGNKGQVNYSASKEGIIGFSRSLAREVASKKITVNVISPGFIITDMIKDISINKKKFILDSIPIKRFGFPKEIAFATTFLASNKASYITGHTLHINGGIFMN